MEINIKALENLTDTAKDFVQKLIFPAAEEVGGLLADRLKLFRLKNQVDVLTRAQNYLNEKNIKTKKISLKVMAPLLENCSLEEDESLKEKWAALIANTVTEDSELESTLYSHLLSQITNRDAQIFQLIFTLCTTKQEGKAFIYNLKQDTIVKASDLSHAFGWDISTSEYNLAIDNLLRLRLIKEVKTYGLTTEMVALSDLGFKFKLACDFK